MASEHDEGSGPAAAPDPNAPQPGSAGGAPRANPYASIDADPAAGLDGGGTDGGGTDGNKREGDKLAGSMADHPSDPAPGEAEGMAQTPGATPKAPLKGSPKDALIEALMELAGERVWEDITLSDIATRANLSLADFRDAFPSKGAVLAGFSRKIDRIVLEGTGDDLAGEPAKERLFDVLMRRLDALAPYKLGLESVTEWLGRAPLAAAAVNRLEVNSMRFMLEAAGIDSEGPVGAVKLQGLVIAWGRVIQVWLRDDDPALSKTMNALDRELTRGARIVGRADDINRLVSPLIALTKAMFERRPDYPRETSRPAEEPTGF